MRKSRSVRRSVMFAGVALLASGMIQGALAQTRRAEKPTPRTTREAALLPMTKACVVDPARELFITDVSVVDDCFRTTWSGACGRPVAPATQGAWTFGGLMPGIFGTTDPNILSDEVIAWLKEWAVLQTVNGDPVPDRSDVHNLVIKPWVLASGGTPLDMKLAPFRLLAIVARLDLRQPSSAPGGITAGEGRFVFNLLDAGGNPTEFLLIFEYGLDARTCEDVLKWAKAWHHLGTLSFGPKYNAALQTITDLFTTIGTSPHKPNKSSLNQARTNDFFLARPWELREFTLQAAGGPVDSLRMHTVALTPANSHQHSQLFADFVNFTAPPFDVPLTFMGTPFLGGASRHSIDFDWDGPPPACTSIFNFADRHEVSLNTCNGCHGAETNTRFKHVEPRLPGTPSALSAFMIGGPAVTDMCGLSHGFNEFKRRSKDLCTLLESSCRELEAEPVIKTIH